MHATFYPRAALVLPLVALLSACGGPKQSPETQRYLQQLTATIDQLNRDLSQESAPKAPEAPNLVKVETPANMEEFMQARKDLNAYYAAVTATIGRVSALCDKAQAGIHKPDIFHVDAAAMSLGDRYGSLTDRRWQLSVNLKAFIMSQQAGLAKGRMSLYASRLVAAGVAAMLAPTNGAGGGSDFTPTAAEKSEMDSQAVSVQQAAAQLESDTASVAAARGDLGAALKVQYPGTDWGFLAAG